MEHCYDCFWSEVCSLFNKPNPTEEELLEMEECDGWQTTVAA